MNPHPGSHSQIPPCLSPTSWLGTESGLGSIRPHNGVLPYGEGLFVGYRGYDCDGQAPLYWFGQGLGLSAWKYVSINAPRQSASGAGRGVAIGLHNFHRRAFEHWNVDAGRCAVEPGIFRLAASPPSAVLPISTDVAILPERRRSTERS